MRYKRDLYKQEQEGLADTIICILNLDSNNSITLYDLDNNEAMKQKIIELIPEARKYFSYNNINGLTRPDKMKRPYLSLIRQITKVKYIMNSEDIRIERNGKFIRTKLYTFV